MCCLCMLNVIHKLQSLLAWRNPLKNALEQIQIVNTTAK